MVDQERLERILRRVTDDLATLATYRDVPDAGLLALRLAAAVGFRNVLVHGYATVDHEKVIDNLQRLDDLERFVDSLAGLLDVT